MYFPPPPCVQSFYCSCQLSPLHPHPHGQYSTVLQSENDCFVYTEIPGVLIIKSDNLLTSAHARGYNSPCTHALPAGSMALHDHGVVTGVVIETSNSDADRQMHAVLRVELSFHEDHDIALVYNSAYS